MERLTGRSDVELTVEKGDGTSFSPEAGGEPRKTATLQVEVADGAYNGTKLSTVNQAMDSRYSVPLEIMPYGHFELSNLTTLSMQYCPSLFMEQLPWHTAKVPRSTHLHINSSIYITREAYTTARRELLSQIQIGDVIKSAKLIDDQDRLIVPNAS
ncbi:hypothetical protein SAY86_012030 [Trapa natans]|uniref:Uncharacterized protein n=1 Tax=Trapa natans TaxID=22666 RepID=A0AAN7LW40_TRANT|nr:hypothetical protein SAY86_012030 [Trapa natans]